VAVEAFIEGKIRFVDIVPIVKEVLDSCGTQEITRVGDVFAADHRGRVRTGEVIENKVIS